MQRVRVSRHFVITAIVCIAVAGIILGCSEEKHYKVLSFFFDGVPLPGGARVAGGEGSAVLYPHQPYAENKCGACHGDDRLEMSVLQPTNIKRISSDVCITCHAEVQREYPIMHGPVVSTLCLMCHAPHESTIKHLLKMPTPRVCTQCHTPEMMSDRQEHKDPKSDCLSCHMAHGGETRGLLKSHPTTAPSAFAPSTLPAIVATPTTAPVVSLPTASVEGMGL